MKTYGRVHYSFTILDFGTRWKCVVSFTPMSLYTPEKSPWYPLTRRLGGPEGRPGRVRIEKNPFRCRGSNPRLPARSPLLYQLSYPGSLTLPQLTSYQNSSYIEKLNMFYVQRSFSASLTCMRQLIKENFYIFHEAVIDLKQQKYYVVCVDFRTCFVSTALFVCYVFRFLCIKYQFEHNEISFSYIVLLLGGFTSEFLHFIW
jgi:hypothetical protein